MMEKGRQVWLDLAKGLGIVAVVMGHSGDPVAHHYLFWFHMPLFFAVSGAVFKPLSGWDKFWPWVGKRARQLLIPYLCFGLLINIFRWLLFTPPNFSFLTIGEDLFSVIYGGQMLSGLFGPFWFITVLFLTQISFAALVLGVRRKSLHAVIIVLAYLLAHFLGWLWKQNELELYIPWDADVTLLALTYYSLGFYCRSLLTVLRTKTWAQGLIVFSTITLFSLESRGLFTFELDMKHRVYNDLLLDIVIPGLLVLCVVVLCHWLTNAKRVGATLTNLGAASLQIMYLHIAANFLIKLNVDYVLIPFTLIGLVVPYLLNRLVFEKYPLTRRLFLGRVTD